MGVNEAVGDDNSDFDYGYGNENEGQNMFDGEGSQDSGFGQEGRGSASSGHSTDHHFSFYAFEGRTGELRWKHEVGPNVSIGVRIYLCMFLRS